MTNFLELLPRQPVKHDASERCHQTHFSVPHNSIIASPTDTSMYNVGPSEKCCAACRCECLVGGCNSVDTGQQLGFLDDRPRQMLEAALNSLMRAPSSEASYGSTLNIDPESQAPLPVAAPSLDMLSRSSANRTCQEMRADRLDIDADPWPYFISPLEEDSNQCIDDADMFGMQGLTDSTLVTPGMSSSSISLLSNWPILFRQGGNTSNTDLVGIGGGAEPDTFLHSSSADRH